MKANLKILILKAFVMSMELNITFRLLELPNKMGLLKGKIESCKKWQEPCFMKTYFWAKVVNTSCYTLNRVLIKPSLDKTPYELWKNKNPYIIYFKVF